MALSSYKSMREGLYSVSKCIFEEERDGENEREEGRGRGEEGREGVGERLARWLVAKSTHFSFIGRRVSS